MKGIEPSYAAWEVAVLPLNYTRLLRPWLLPGDYVVRRVAAVLVFAIESQFAILAKGKGSDSRLRIGRCRFEIRVGQGVEQVVVIYVNGYAILGSPMIVERPVAEPTFWRSCGRGLAFKKGNSARVSRIRRCCICSDITEDVEKKFVACCRTADGIANNHIARGCRRAAARCRILSVFRIVGFQCRHDVRAGRFRLGFARLIFDAVDGLKEQAHQDRDDGDDRQEFDQGEGVSAVLGVWMHEIKNLSRESNGVASDDNRKSWEKRQISAPATPRFDRLRGDFCRDRWVKIPLFIPRSVRIVPALSEKLFHHFMSQHRSLKGHSTSTAKRNGLKRFERVEILKSRGQFKVGDKALGLRKTKPNE